MVTKDSGRSDYRVPSNLTNGEKQLLKILIVENNVDDAETMAIILRTLDHDVRINFNGIDGLAVADEFQPAVVLLDIDLAGIDGYEVAQRLRERRGDSLIILAISGYCQPADRERSRLAGIDLHLVKPVDPENLLSYLAFFLGLKDQEALTGHPNVAPASQAAITPWAGNAGAVFDRSGGTGFPVADMHIAPEQQ